MTAIRTFALFLAASALAAPVAHAATFGDLSGGDRGSQGPAVSGPYAPGPYAANPYASASMYGLAPYAGYGAARTSGGPEGVPPPMPGASAMPPTPYPPEGPRTDLPPGPLQAETFGQINSTTDPYNPWGLSTPFMFVPWSTPLSGWTNAQTWNWWRERSGAPPRNW